MDSSRLWITRIQCEHRQGGKTYPIKWQLTDADGLYVSDLSAVTSITYTARYVAPSAVTRRNAHETSVTGGTSLRYDCTVNQLIYNWKTTFRQLVAIPFVLK
jgi:hypothetical protein